MGFVALVVIAGHAQADGVPDFAQSGFVGDLAGAELFSMPDLGVRIVDADGVPVEGQEVSLWTTLDIGEGLTDFVIASNHPACGNIEDGFGAFCITYNVGTGNYDLNLVVGAAGAWTVHAYLGYAQDDNLLIDSLSAVVPPPAGAPSVDHSTAVILDADGEEITTANVGDTITFFLTLADRDGVPVTAWDTGNIIFAVNGADTGFPLPWVVNGGGAYEATIALPTAGQFNISFRYGVAPGAPTIEMATAYLEAVPGPVRQFILTNHGHTAIPGHPFTFRINAGTEGDINDPNNPPSLVSFGPNVLGDSYDVVVSVDGVTDGVGLGQVTLDFTQDGGGVADHTILFPAVGAGQVVTVTSVSDPTIDGSSSPIDVAIGPATGSTSSIEAPAVPAAVGDPAVFTVKLRDIAGNPVTGAESSISFYLNDEGSSLGAGGGPGGNLFEVAPGDYEFSYIHLAPGPYFISAYIGANHDGNVGDPIGIAETTAAPGVLAAFRVRGQGAAGSALADQAAGVAFTIEVEAVDADGTRLDSGPNLLDGLVEVDVALASGNEGAGIGAGIALTFDDGLATHQITLTVPHVSDEVVVTLADDAGIAGQTDAFDLHPGALAAFRFEFVDGTPFEDVAPRTAGVLHSLQLRAVDAHGNTLDAGPHVFTGTVNLSSNAAGVTPVGLGATPAFTAGVLTLDAGPPDRRIALTQAQADARFTAQQAGGAGVTSHSDTFEVLSDGIVSTVASTVEAVSPALVDAEVTVSITLRDQFQNVLTDPRDLVLTLSDQPGELFTPVQAGDAYTFSFTRGAPGPVTVRVHLGDSEDDDLLGEVAVSFQSAPPPEEPGPPVDPGEDEVVEEAGAVLVPIAGAHRVPLEGSTSTTAVSERPGGRSVRVTVPASALGESGSTPGGGPLAEGLRLETSLVDDLDAVETQAPAPTAGRVVGQFVARLVDADGQTVRATFTEPVTIEFTMPLEDLPADATGEELVLVYWNGTQWVEVPATPTFHEGHVTLRAEVLHFTLFSILLAGDEWGTFDVTMRLGPVSFGTWRGGTHERLAAAARGSAVWTYVGGRWLAYRPGAPAHVNTRFLDVFADGLGAGAAVVIRSSW